MTRINLVNVEDLADQHLFAEWREIKMVPAALRRSLKTKSVTDVLESIPKKFTLNKGHVLFFYNKMQFLSYRYEQLTVELHHRGYELQEHHLEDIFYKNIPEVFNKDWRANTDDIKISAERIVLRLTERPTWYRHWGNVVPPEDFKQLYEMQYESGR